jgi:lysophospholipid acyltransferase (LPLAT)-like uncharacterized protein
VRLDYAALGLGYYAYSRLFRVYEEPLPEVAADRRRRGLPTVFAHWHGDELLMIGVYAFRGMNVLVSTSRDGGIMAGGLRALGFHVARGSSSRGPVRGLVGLIHQARANGGDVSLAVDGPRGPRHVVKSGVLTLARKLDSPVIPSAACARWRYVFRRSWNQAYLPLPLTRAWMIYGAPVFVPAILDGAAWEAKRLEVEAALQAANQRVMRIAGVEHERRDQP